MSWWTKHRKYINPIKAIDKGIEKLNEAVGWEKPGDGPQGVDVYIGTSQPIDEELINQNYASQDLAKANNTAETWDDYVDIAKQSNYLSQETKQQLEQSKTTNQGENKMATTASTADQNWFERNSEYIMPLLTTALTTGAQMWYNNYQQKSQNAYNSQEAELNRQFNADQAQINRDWQENMSNTAITRQVSDLTNAGINPILASQLGGSAVTSGSQASGTPASSAGLMPMSMKDMMSTALTQAEIANMRADTELKQKDAGKSESETKMINLQTGITEINSQLEQALMRTQDKKLQQEIQVAQKELGKIKEETDLIKAEKELKEWESRHPVLTKLLPGAAGIAGGIVGAAIGGPAGMAVGAGMANIGKQKIGF